MADELVIAGRSFSSRLLVGTGKFSSNAAMRGALDASGAEIVTVAMRRVDLTAQEENILQAVDRQKYLLLPNTSGARDHKEAIRIAMMARELGCGNWLKLEITPEPRTLLPDPVETYEAAKQLVKEGFIVLPYINADPILALRLQDIGCATVMPLAAPIGTNKGLKTEDQIRIIVQQARVPVVVDAGLGAPSHAAAAMELGASAVLVNTAIAVAGDPARMAAAFREAVKAGREARLAGLGSVSAEASASSPLTGFLNS